MTKNRSTPKNPPWAWTQSAWNTMTPSTASARRPSMPTMREVSEAGAGPGWSGVGVGTDGILPETA